MNQSGPTRFKCYKVANVFTPTLSHQPSHKMIISISADPIEEDKVQLSAFSDTNPHSLVKQLSIEMEHFDYSIVPQTRNASTDRIILALCTVDYHKSPTKLISINTACWTHKSVYVKDVDEVACPNKNCIIISDDLILVALTYSYAVFDKDLQEISNFGSNSIDPKF